MPLLIGITGQKYSGKDTLGNYICETYNFKRLAFADPLKDVCRTIFGFNDEQLYGDKKEEIDKYWKITPRETLQFVGTELFREQFGKKFEHVDKNIWIKVIKKTLLDNPSENYVVTDVRFQNECSMIHELGGVVIKIKRPFQNLDNNFSQHSSEIHIDELNVDYELVNDSTKTILFTQFDLLNLI